MVGNFREVYLFSCFSQVKSHLWKLKPQKFCFPRVKRMNHVSIPGLLLYIAAYKSMSASVPLTSITDIIQMLRKHWRTIQTVAQGQERKQSPRVTDSPIGKIKTAKISEIGILANFTKICTHENYQPHTHTHTPSSQRTVWHSHTSWQAISNASHVTPTPHHFAKASTVSRSKWFVGSSNIRNLGLNKMPVDTLQLVLALGHHWSQRSLTGDDTLPLFALEVCTGSVLVMLCPSQVDWHDAAWSELSWSFCVCFNSCL